MSRALATDRRPGGKTREARPEAYLSTLSFPGTGVDRRGVAEIDSLTRVCSDSKIDGTTGSADFLAGNPPRSARQTQEDEHLHEVPSAKRVAV